MSFEDRQAIIQAFKEGRVDGVQGGGVRPEWVQTELSDVFLFPDAVYKLYRRDNHSFNQLFFDLSDEDVRRDFFRKDYAWNQYFSPAIYLRLMGIEVSNDEIRLVPEHAQVFERVMEMKRVTPSAQLARRLLKKDISHRELQLLGYQMTKMIEEFPDRERRPAPILDQLEVLLHDVEAWCLMSDPLFPRSLTEAALRALREYVRTHAEGFLSLVESDFVAGMDNHSDNIFFENGVLTCIDTYPPKADWRVVERTYAVYRLATDIEIMRGKDCADRFIQGCADYLGPGRPLRTEARWFYTLYSSLIRAPYLFSLSKKDPSRLEEAQQYRAFIERSLS